MAIEPGIYENMSEGQYHRGLGWEALSKSLLVELDRSIAHARSAMDTPREPTQAMQLGTSVHCAILEPERFTEEYTVFTGNRRTKAGRQAYQVILDSGMTPLSQADFTTVTDMQEALRRHSLCRDLLAEGMPEASLFWPAPVWECPCKCRIDFLNPHKQILVDLKTTTDASPRAFARSAAVFKYHWQAYWYLEGVKAVLGPGPWRFIFVAIEKSPPYGVGVYELPDEAIEAAGAQIQERHLVSEYWHARELNKWPGYPNETQVLNLPRWALYTEGEPS